MQSCLKHATPISLHQMPEMVQFAIKFIKKTSETFTLFVRTVNFFYEQLILILVFRNVLDFTTFFSRVQLKKSKKEEN